MLMTIFAVAVVVGFIFWLMATWPISFAERIARGFFLLAAIIFAWMTLSGGGK